MNSTLEMWRQPETPSSTVDTQKCLNHIENIISLGRGTHDMSVDWCFLVTFLHLKLNKIFVSFSTVSTIFIITSNIIRALIELNLRTDNIEHLFLGGRLLVPLLHTMGLIY